MRSIAMDFLKVVIQTSLADNTHKFTFKDMALSGYTLFKPDVTRRDHVSVVVDPRNVGSRFFNFIVNFIRDGTVFA